MAKVPFERFITTMLLFNNSIQEIINRISPFGYYITEPEVLDIFNDIRNILPENIRSLINDRQPLDVSNDTHVQWLKHFEIFELYDYISRKEKNPDPIPPYFKWIEDCLWIHKYKDVMTIINIFLFNKEPLESISDIISFKYKKKIGIETLKLHQSLFWDSETMTAKEALYHCEPFRHNILIIRQLRSGDSTVTSIDDEAHNGSDVGFTFHDSNYIKWKIGYTKGIKVPSTKDFLEGVKRDSYFKYYESMNMTQSVEMENEEGSNEEFGSFDKKTTISKNVEEQRAKMAKQWLDIFLKAEDKIPTSNPSTDNIMERIEQLELGFDEEKIMAIDDAAAIMNDIQGDLR